MALENVKPTKSEDPYAAFLAGAGSEYGPSAPTEWGQPMEIMRVRAAQTNRSVHASAGGNSGGDVIYGEGAQDEMGGGELDESGGGRGGAF